MLTDVLSLHSDVTMKTLTGHTQSVHTQAVNHQGGPGYQTRMLGGAVLSGAIFTPTHKDFPLLYTSLNVCTVSPSCSPFFWCSSSPVSSIFLLFPFRSSPPFSSRKHNIKVYF